MQPRCPRCRTAYISLLLGLAMQGAGCGGSHIEGTLLAPPPLPVGTAEMLAEHAPVPADQTHPDLAHPVAIRAYPSGEVIVDVLVMEFPVAPPWKPAGSTAESSAWKAAYQTNGLNVPATRTSDRSKRPAIEFRSAQGTIAHATRAILGDPPFEENRAYLGAGVDVPDRIRIVVITRGGLRHHACFVPVLLATDQPVKVGDQVEVRIHPALGRRYNIDDRWYRMGVEPVDIPQAVER